MGLIGVTICKVGQILTKLWTELSRVGRILKAEDVPTNKIELPDCTSWNLHETIQNIANSIQLLGHENIQVCEKRKCDVVTHLSYAARGLVRKSENQPGKLLGAEIATELDLLKKRWKQTSNLMWKSSKEYFSSKPSYTCSSDNRAPGRACWYKSSDEVPRNQMFITGSGGNDKEWRECE